MSGYQAKRPSARSVPNEVESGAHSAAFSASRQLAAGIYGSRFSSFRQGAIKFIFPLQTQRTPVLVPRCS